MEKQEKITNGDERIIKGFKLLEFTEYEAKVFLELYRRSPQKAKDISAGSGVSQGRVYGVLQKLTDEGLVIKQTALGTSNTYDIANFPECLEQVKKRRTFEIETAFARTVDNLESLNREKVELEEGGDFSVIKGERALVYYVKKVMNEAEKVVKMNFTPEMLKKYETDIVRMKERGVLCKFVLSEYDLRDKDVVEIVKGGEVYAISLNNLNNPLMEVFRDVRPTMIVADEKIAVIVFFAHSKDGMLVNNPMLLKYQSFILDLFIQGGKKINLE